MNFSTFTDRSYIHLEKRDILIFFIRYLECTNLKKDLKNSSPVVIGTEVSKKIKKYQFIKHGGKSSGRKRSKEVETSSLAFLENFHAPKNENSIFVFRVQVNITRYLQKTGKFCFRLVL